MWFKNATVFQLTRTNYFEQFSLEKSVKKNAFVPCGKTDIKRVGFVSVLPETEDLIKGFDNNNYMFLRVQLEEKVILPDAMQRPLTERIAQIEQSEFRKVTKREKDQLKEDIIFSLLPTAQSKYIFTCLYIDVKNGLIVIDTKKREKAEDILALLRKSIGLLPVTDFINTEAIQTVLKGWISAPQGIDINFQVGQEIKIVGTGAYINKATFVNQDLYDEDLQQFMGSFDYKIKRLKVEFKDMFSFLFTQDGFITQLEWIDMIDYRVNIESEALVQSMEAEMVLFTQSMSDFFNGLKTMGIVLHVEKEIFEGRDLEYSLIAESA